jgi:hypothetical protein
MAEGEKLETNILWLRDRGPILCFTANPDMTGYYPLNLIMDE